jgi:NADH dehydrogenase
MFSPGVKQSGMDAVTAASGEWAAETMSAADPFAAAVDPFAVAADPFAVAVDPFAAAADPIGEAAAGISDTVTAATDAAADAVTAATGAATEAVSGAFKAVWDLTKPIFSFNGVVATWFRTTFMDGIMAYIPFQGFQLMIVLMEMAIGLAMIGGLFTWWAAAASIVMCIVFTLSGMFAWNQVWFIFAGFLLLGGAGRAFGLDCWVVPVFKKWWNGTKFARRHHWYLDGPAK